jgi:hypothetical protein
MTEIVTVLGAVLTWSDSRELGRHAEQIMLPAPGRLPGSIGAFAARRGQASPPRTTRQARSKHSRRSR